MADTFKMTTGTPTLKSKQIFLAVHVVTTVKMTKKIKGFSSTYIHLQPGNRFLMDYGFVRGHLTEKYKKREIYVISYFCIDVNSLLSYSVLKYLTPKLSTHKVKVVLLSQRLGVCELGA